IRPVNVYLPEPSVSARPPSQAHTATSTPGLVNEIWLPHCVQVDGTESLISSSRMFEVSTRRAANRRAPPDQTAIRQAFLDNASRVGRRIHIHRRTGLQLFHHTVLDRGGNHETLLAVHHR